jgi:hypothetical protein
VREARTRIHGYPIADYLANYAALTRADALESYAGIVHATAVPTLSVAVNWPGGLDAWYAHVTEEMAHRGHDHVALIGAADVLVTEGRWPRPYAMAAWGTCLEDGVEPDHVIRHISRLCADPIARLWENCGQYFPDALR